ncbi:hypothetical protein BD414DRAFT_540009 [Trametes punicea]|nr:hypothetical protein BD414DRAFT_540009 [Trametes punicea]
MADVTLEDVQRILDQHRGGSTTISDFKPLDRTGFEIFTPTKAYVVRVDDGTSYILKATPPASTASITYAPNTLAMEHALLKLVASQTDIPHPTIHVLDTSHSIVPYPYLLLSHPRGIPLSAARASGKLSPRQAALLDLRTGAYLKQLHERVQNDWFGLPSQEQDALYSWQEAFTLLLESLLEDARAAGVELPYEDVRQYLSRAIGFFLFDDCEVPSLISFTGDEDATFAFVEGYGGPLIVFGRQKTKRLWYTIFLALVVLLQAKRSGETENEKVKWATEVLHRSVADLKDAPCY